MAVRITIRSRQSNRRRLSTAFHNYGDVFPARPEPVEGRTRRSWFDKLTTNGNVTVIAKWRTKQTRKFRFLRFFIVVGTLTLQANTVKPDVAFGGECDPVEFLRCFNLEGTVEGVHACPGVLGGVARYAINGKRYVALSAGDTSSLRPTPPAAGIVIIFGLP